MKDTHEANLPTEENGKLEETKAPETTPENTAEEVVTNETTDAEVAAEETSEAEVKTDEVAAGEETVATTGKLSKEEILEKLTGLVGAAADATRNEVEALKQAYYKIHRSEVDELKKAFLTAGGEEKDFVAPEDETESKIKELLNVYKEKRAAILAEEERVKAANYALKLQLIDQLKALTESQEDFNKLYNDFKDIQQRWKEVKAVPQEHVSELWKNYQTYSEMFYDIIKINNQFRDYDFKKNLEMKTALCETVEKLQTEPDVISAFHQLQKLHQQWREIGPVAKELREDLWSRFKAASTIINKRHQEHFEGLKAKEQENLEAKTAICEQIENIDFPALKSFKDWEEKNKEVIALQDKWKTIGFAPKKSNVKIFERFRAACDVYFNRKSEFYKNIKDEMEKNLALKKALCEKAEALKDSTDWKATADKLMQIQKEWKTIGAVPKKHSESLWQRFIGACDYFFEQKGKNTASQRGEEKENLQKKEQVIEKLKALLESDEEENKQDAVRELMREWNEIGFVPFKEKDKIYKAYHETVDQLFKALNMSAARRRLDNFKNNLKNDAKEGGQGLSRERERLVRAYENKRSEIKTYENNLGFLTCSSKKGSNLLNEMNKKMEKLKDELNLIGEKIAAIDKEMSAQAE